MIRRIHRGRRKKTETPGDAIEGGASARSQRRRPARPAAWSVFIAGAVLAGCSLGDGAFTRHSPGGGRSKHGAARAATGGGESQLSAEIEPAPYDPAKFPSPPALVDASPDMGSTPGGFAVTDDGAATYTLPLRLPPGRAGLEPRLALAYNSSGGNGYLGVGMSLTGFSAISRCPNNVRDDGAKRAVWLDKRDRFCIDGQRLVAVNGGEYGADGTEYRTVPDSFVKIVSHGGSNGDAGYTGPRTFTVYGRDGKVREYGADFGSTVVVGDIVRQWAITKVSDRKGNAIEYDYVTFPITGPTFWGNVTYTFEQRPFRVRYTTHESGLQAQHRVLFDYDDARPDSLMGHALGVRKTISSRLSKLRVIGPGDALVREYNLGYGLTEGTHKSVLETVTECVPGACQRPTRFTWASPRAGFPFHDSDGLAAPPSGPEGVSSLLSLDVNGDGREDLVYPTLEGWSLLISNPDNLGRSPYTTVKPSTATNPGFNGAARLWLRGLPFDYDGDGLGDLLLTDSSETWQVLRSTGDDFVNVSTGLFRARMPDVTPGHRNQASNVILADLDGDGLKDLVEYWGFSNGLTDPMRCIRDPETGEWPACRWRRRQNTGAGFGELIDIGVLKDVDLGSLFALDVDGDGKEELLAAHDDGTRKIHWREGNGQGPVQLKLTDSGLRPGSFASSRVLIDVNGDGLKDIVTSSDTPTPIFGVNVDHQLIVQLNTGRDFLPPELAVPNEPDLPEFEGAPLTLMGAQLSLALTLDYDGDGDEDLLLPYPDMPVVPDDHATSRLTRFLLLEARDGFLYVNGGALNTYQPGGSFYEDIDRLINQGPRAIDHNGDGYRDHVSTDAPGGHIFAETHEGGEAMADVVIKIDDGAASYTADAPSSIKAPTVTIGYGHLLEGEHYTQTVAGDAPCRHPCVRYSGPRHVVAEHQLRGLTGAGDPTSTRPGLIDIRHDYAGARVDALGRGWLGLRSHRTQENVVDEGLLRKGLIRKTIYDNITFDPLSQSFPFAGRPAVSFAFDREACSTADADPPDCYWLSTQEATPLLMYGNGGATHFTVPLLTYRREYGHINDDVRPDLRSVNALTVGELFGPVGPPSPMSEVMHITGYDEFGNLTTDATNWFDPADPIGSDVSSTIERTYQNDAGRWLVGLPRLTTITDRVRHDTTARVSETFYDDDTGLPRRVTVATPDDVDHWVDTEFERDDFGNVVKVTATDADGQKRQQAFTYEPDGIFLHASRNALGHTTYVKYDPLLGTLVESVDPKGLRSRLTYDRLGELRHALRPDGSSTSRDLARESMGGELFVSEHVTTPSAGETLTRYDRFGRAFYERWRGPEVSQHEARRTFTVEGQVRDEFLPTFAGGDAPGKNSYAYDTKGRLVGVSFADGTAQSFSYAGPRTDFVDQRGNRSYTVANVRGQLVQAVDAALQSTTFSHGPFGTLLSVVDPKGNTRSTTYDAYGRPVKTIDPDTGERTMVYNAFGELVSQFDAVEREYYFDHDALGRTTQMRQFRQGGSVIEQETIYGYDIGGATAIGELSSVNTLRPAAPDGWHLMSYRYDALGRVRRIDHVLPTPDDPTAGEQLRFELTYDGLSRLDTLTYPKVPNAQAFALKHSYTPFGHLKSVTEVGATKPFWATGSLVDQAGRPIESNFGNGTKTAHFIDQLTGRTSQLLTLSRTIDGESVTLQNLRYLYDNSGNLSDRIDELQGRTEHFTYDALDRLKTGKLAGTASPRYQYSYDELGNLTSKSGVGAYTYEPGRPHVLATAGGQAYGHDAVGNQTSRPGNIELAYDALDKPVRMTQNGVELASFLYDGLGTRVRKTTPTGVTTYAGELYERHQKDDGSVEHVLRVAVGGSTVAEVVFTAASAGVAPTRTERYLHPDHLGSPDLITGPDGTVIERRSYDPFGKRRSPNWVSTLEPPGPLTTSEGFTGHEEDDELGLVHMKGRTYDPQLGRFLQADPFVQAPAFSQSWNRYAYVLNNPLSLTDPSGFRWAACRTCSGGWVWINDDRGGGGGGNSGGGVGNSGGGSGGDFTDTGFVDGNDILQPYQANDPRYIANEVTIVGTQGVVPPTSTGSQVGHDPTWAWGRGGGAPEAGRERSEGVGGGGGPVSGRRAPANPNDIGYRLAVGVTDALDERLEQLPKDFADTVLVVESVMGAASAAKLGFTVLKSLGSGLWKNGGTALAKALASPKCFAAGTEVWTADGLVPIEQVREGQLVLSRDEETGELGWKRVVRTFITLDQTTLALSLTDAEQGEHEQVEATAEHPFWAEGRGWVGAGELRAGERVLRGDGRWLRVEGVETRSGRRTVYNLEVEGWHTYVVGGLGAWVHNAPCNLTEAVKSAARSAAKISKSVKCYGMCKQFADRLESALVNKGISGTRIKISVAGKYAQVTSATVGPLGEPGMSHMAIRVGDTVFDNLRPGGIPYQQFMDDLNLSTALKQGLAHVAESIF